MNILRIIQIIIGLSITALMGAVFRLAHVGYRIIAKALLPIQRLHKTKSIKPTLTIGVVVTALIAGGFVEKAFAPPGRHGLDTSSISFQGWGYPTAPPIVHQPMMPPGFPHKWVTRDVVKSFNENGLEVENVKPVKETENLSLPANTEEAIEFSIPSSGEDVAGCILCFEDKDDMEKVTEHYRELNKEGELYNWSFVKDNILLILKGSLPEEVAREYEKVLYEMNPEDRK